MKFRFLLFRLPCLSIKDRSNRAIPGCHIDQFERNLWHPLERSLAMNTKSVAWLLWMCIFAPQPILAQGMGEYGRLLGGVGPKTGGTVPKVSVPKAESNRGGNFQSPKGNNQESDPLPSGLVVESDTTALYARSEEWSDKVMQLSRGDKLIPMMKTAGGQMLWYMVKTETGQSGWVKAPDVSSNSTQKK
jgi:hypothetical protein